MIWASLVYLLVLWAPFWRSRVAVASSWLRGLVGGAGVASFEWSRGVGKPVRRSSLSSGSLDARKARGQRQRDRSLEGRAVRRVEGHVVDVPVFEVVKCDSQERVQEPNAEHARVSVVKLVVSASTVVESVDGGEARLQGVEESVLKMVSHDHFLDVLVTRVEEQLVVVPRFVCQDRVQQRTFERFSLTFQR